MKYTTSIKYRFYRISYDGLLKEPVNSNTYYHTSALFYDEYNSIEEATDAMAANKDVETYDEYTLLPIIRKIKVEE